MKLTPGARKWLLASVASMAVCGAQPARQVDDAALKTGSSDGSEWLSYNVSWSEQRYSPLKQINAENVARLGLAWSYDIPAASGNPQVHQEATPLVFNGVLYSIGPWSVVYAVDLRTGKIRGAEALLRWREPSFGQIAPTDFIPIAELSGLIVPIGEWVLRTACARVRAWHRAGFPHLSIAVNLSSRQFQQSGLLRQVTSALEESGMPASALDLEITETNAMQNAEASISTLGSLKELGVSLSMDDFGTGYSSLNYLKRFPIDRIKIDQSFVRDVTQDSDAAAIVAAVIAMAHSLQISVVAEGVETDEQLAILRQSACDEMQGYLFSPPVGEREFEELLRADRTLAPNNDATALPARK